MPSRFIFYHYNGKHDKIYLYLTNILVYYVGNNHNKGCESQDWRGV